MNVHVVVLAVLCAVLAALAMTERWLHCRRLARIGIRIHVNGTRGKSSVTRLVAAGLRAAGIVTCAKTTGSAARFILPDGRERPIVRGSRPSVLEQIGVVRAAAAVGAEALVVECMALTPSLQWLSQSQLIRATHAVITNAREDHLDVMGPSKRDVAWALSGMIPPGGVLFTADERHGAVFRSAALDRQCRLVMISPSEIAAVTAEELARFSYTEHPENVALALAVCAALGVDRETALAGMWQAVPDPGVLAQWQWRDGSRQFHLASALAANDPQSSATIWHAMGERLADVDRRIALVNCRADRPERSRQLGQAMAGWRSADYYLVTGSGTQHFVRAAARAGLDMRKIVVVPGRNVEAVFQAIERLAGSSTLVVALGNIGGLGLELLQQSHDRHWQNRPAAAAVSGTR